MNFLLYLPLLTLLEEALAELCLGKYVHVGKKELLKTNLTYPREFAIDKTLNTIYFSHGRDKQLARLHLGTKVVTNIESVKSRSQAVNQRNHDVYIVPETGIYKYKPRTREFEFMATGDKTVDSVFFLNGTLYFTENWSDHVHTLEKGLVTYFLEIRQQKDDHFVIDFNGVIYYTHDRELRSMKTEKEEEKGYDYKYQNSEGLMYRALTLDNNGEVLVCTYYGIFSINKYRYLLEGIALQDTKYCSGIAVDKDNNIIYSDGNSIFRLKMMKECVN